MAYILIINLFELSVVGSAYFCSGKKVWKQHFIPSEG